MATTKKTTKDFKLISNITKARIKGLIEKRLTAQTIALFAQEYETYDAGVREEILDYIFYLLESEEQQLNAQEPHNTDIRNKILYDKRKMELNEKKTNIMKIQKILTEKPEDRTKAFTAQKPAIIKVQPEVKKLDLLATATKDVEPAVSEPKPKPAVAEKKPVAKETEATKIAKMIKDAEEREAKAAREEKRRNDEKKAQMLAEEKRRNEEKKAKKADLPKKEVTSKTASEKAKQVAAEKEKAVQVAAIDRDYEKEQREKEKLWLELYGKSRQASLKERDQQKAAEFKTTGEDDKRPSMEMEIDPTDFKIGDDIYLVDEVVNPKNRCYVFWNNIKFKYNVPSIYVLIKNTPYKVLKKVSKQRKKFEKKIRKTGGTTPKAETIKKMNAAKQETKAKK